MFYNNYNIITTSMFKTGNKFINKIFTNIQLKKRNLRANIQ